MATVCLADDVMHGRKVAVKVLRPELAATMGSERFPREIKTVAQFNHPHILSLYDSGYDSGEVEGFLFYVMPHVDGESLKDRLAREHQLPFHDTTRILREVAEALAYSHQRGTPKPLTAWTGFQASPVWSGDGSTVHFYSDRDSKLGDLWRVAPSGGEPTRVTTNLTIGGNVASRAGVPELFTTTLNPEPARSDSPVFVLTDPCTWSGLAPMLFSASSHQKAIQ